MHSQTPSLSSCVLTNAQPSASLNSELAESPSELQILSGSVTWLNLFRAASVRRAGLCVPFVCVRLVSRSSVLRQQGAYLDRFTPLPANIQLWNATEMISVGSTVKNVLLLFQSLWFYVPFVYRIVNGVYFSLLCCTVFFFFHFSSSSSVKDTRDKSLYCDKYEILIASPRECGCTDVNTFVCFGREVHRHHDVSGLIQTGCASRSHPITGFSPMACLSLSRPNDGGSSKKSPACSQALPIRSLERSLGWAWWMTGGMSFCLAVLWNLFIVTDRPYEGDW